jgi:hypothetical protein
MLSLLKDNQIGKRPACFLFGRYDDSSPMSQVVIKVALDDNTYCPFLLLLLLRGCLLGVLWTLLYTSFGMYIRLYVQVVILVDATSMTFPQTRRSPRVRLFDRHQESVSMSSCYKCTCRSIELV